MLLFFPSQPGRILQARQNFASPNFCLGSLERFRAEQNQIPEFPHAYKGSLITTAVRTYLPASFLPFFLSRKIAPPPQLFTASCGSFPHKHEKQGCQSSKEIQLVIE
jgi:hypothetical protein